jgi:hypothetical protein
MDKQEAKLLLQSYRPDGRDAGDPAFAEALALARQDQELGDWFRRECELDAAIAAKLAATEVPADLRQTILAGQRSQRQLVRADFSWWRSPAMAWAAAIAVLFVGAFFFRSQGGTTMSITAYRNAMATHLNSGFVFDVRNEQPEILRAWLAERRVFADLQVPDTLKSGRAIGCQMFEFEGRKSALICFTLADKKVVHLFVTDAAGFETGQVAEEPSLCRCDKWNACFWRKNDLVYLAMGSVNAGQLAEIAGLGPAEPANAGQNRW